MPFSPRTPLRHLGRLGLLALAFLAPVALASGACGGDDPPDVGTGGAGGGSTSASASTSTDVGSGLSGGGTPGPDAGPKGPCEEAAATRTSAGCEFYAVNTPIIPIGKGACFAAFLANTSSSPARVKVSYGGADLPVESFARIPKGQGAALTYEPFDAEAGLAPGEVLLLFLSRMEGGLLVDCPAPAAVTTDAAVVGTGRGQAFRIETDQPVAAYQILPYGGASAAATSASLLLPTGAWGDNYVAVTPYAQSQVQAPDPSQQPENAVIVVGRQAGTEVTILARTAIEGGEGIEPVPAGQTKTYPLGAGEFLQLQQGPELIGSVIQTNKPVGLFGAASCMNIPTTTHACDTAQQQIPPVRALGSEYVGVHHPARPGASEASPWRLVGAADGTALTWEPAAPPGAPTALNLGEVAEFQATGPFVVRSQDDAHPFYAASYMTGGEPHGAVGDPEWVNIVPTGQYLRSYVLLTDPTYPDTSLVLVRRPGEDGAFADVTLGCAGPIGGWQPLGAFEYAYVPLVQGGAGVGACANGRHELTSQGPFAVTVWGWGHAVSYAYPGGAGIEAINDVVVPPVPK